MLTLYVSTNFVNIDIVFPHWNYIHHGELTGLPYFFFRKKEG